MRAGCKALLLLIVFSEASIVPSANCWEGSSYYGKLYRLRKAMDFDGHVTNFCMLFENIMHALRR